MTTRIIIPTKTETWLGQWDGRWKLLCVILAIAIFACLRHLGPAIVACLATLVLIWQTGVAWKWYRERVSVLLPLVLGLIVLLPWLSYHTDDFELILWGPFRLSLHGFLLAMRISAQAMGILNLVLVLLLTTPIPVLIQSAHALYIPSFLIQLVSLTYRYLFLLMEELAQLRIALRVRGYRNRANLHSYRMIGNVTGILLMRGAERGERVGQAMRCRGYQGRFPAMTSFQTTLRDIGIALLIMIISLALFLWEWSLS